MSDFPKGSLNRVRRLPERGAYDKATIYPIIDEALICHVSFVQDGQPFIIPTIHARREDELLLHGSSASRLLKHIVAGNPVSVAITLLDGLVVARSAFHSSMNYRSAVLFGHGREITAQDEKLLALETLTNHLLSGRWDDVRPTTARELAATTVIAIAIESASAKVRTGPPKDDEDDYELPIWAGVLPLQQTALAPVPDAGLPETLPAPDYIAHYSRSR